MRHNPVEMMTIVNPSGNELASDRLRMFVIGSAVVGVGYGLYVSQISTTSTDIQKRYALFGLKVAGIAAAAVIIDHLFIKEKREVESNPRRIKFSDVEWWEAVEQDHHALEGFVGEELIGEIEAYGDEEGYRYRLADEWHWSPAETAEEAQRALVGDYNLSLYEESENIKRNRGERYFVSVSGDAGSYPKQGSKYYPKGYPLKKAKDFARIGSQTGGPREVRRGRKGGPRVRTYKEGKRIWPTTKDQARNLLQSEVPKRLRKR